MALALARHAEGFFSNARTQKLFYTAFFPAQGDVKGVVLFMHGINEHCHRFKHVYEVLVMLGFGVIAYDMVSHGKSDCDVHGLRGHAENFHHMVDDTNAFLAFAKSAIYTEMLPPHQQKQMPRLFFMGISYGCLVGLRTILSKQHKFSGVVLAAPAIGVEQTFTLWVLGLLAAPLAWAFPHAKIVPGVNFDGLCRDKAFVQDYLSDELNVTENMTARMGTLTMEAMQSLLNNAEMTDPSSDFCKLPILVIQGTADIVTSVAMARTFHDRIANTDKQMKEYDGLFHCLFNEPEKEEILGDVTNWLLTHTPQQ